MSVFLGVDGGGSKTHALVVNQRGEALGFGAAGCGNHQIHGLEAAVTEIQHAAQAALEQAGRPPGGVQTGCFCLSGADLEEDYALLAEAMQALRLVQTVVVKNDTLAALRAAVTRPWGVVVICGSGFNAAARSPQGEEIVLPGLGYISGDWGGGGQLSHEMIRLVMRAWDGRGEPTLLTGLVLAHFQAASEAALLERLYHGTISDWELLALVPLLFEATEAGDQPARDLITRLGEEVAVTACALIRRLGLQETDVEVGLAGGVFRGEGPLLVETVTRRIQQVVPQARIRKTHFEPVVGAALLALESAGKGASTALYRRLEATLPEQLRLAGEGKSPAVRY